jgi:hypothetical protein
MNVYLVLASWLNVTNVGQTVVNVLAIAGGFFLGAWLSGWLLQRLTRLLTPKKVYPTALWVVRVAGGAAVALLVAYFVFGTGGWGLGGGGPDGKGPGEGGLTTTSNGDHKAKNRVGPQEDDKLPPVAEKTLRVEVLGLLKGQPITNGQVYRIEGKAQLRSLPDVLEEIDKRKAGTPPLEKVEIVLYKDSPDRNTPAVEELRSAVSRKGLEAAITEVQAKAPPGKGA